MTAAPRPPGLRALTLDLDDTLWPVWPAILRAEEALHDWLRVHAPATAAAHDRAGLRRLREQVGREHPERAHDLGWLRQHSIAQALQGCGEDPALAGAAFELFMDHRQRVELYPEVPTALATLAARWPILALTNGNADMQRIGLAQHLVGTLGARDFGVGKPAPAFFLAACERLGCAPHEVLHIGDDWHLDIEGAAAAGLHSAWVHRPGQPPAPEGARARPWRQVAGLDELVRALA